MGWRPSPLDGLAELGYLALVSIDSVESRKPYQYTTLLELRKRAEWLNGKMHGGSLMLCDVNTFLACLDGLATELEAAYSPDPGMRYAYQLAAQRLRGQDVEL